jgi:hypothetical protein
VERETRQNFSKSAFALTNQFQITAEQYSLANVEDVKMNLAVKRRSFSMRRRRWSLPAGRQG